MTPFLPPAAANSAILAVRNLKTAQQMEAVIIPPACTILQAELHTKDRKKEFNPKWDGSRVEARNFHLSSFHWLNFVLQHKKNKTFPEIMTQDRHMGHTKGQKTSPVSFEHLIAVTVRLEGFIPA